MRRYAQRVDANQSEIVKAFRDADCSVEILNDLIDAAVGYGGLTMLIEIKDGDKPLKEGRQKRFHETWKGGLRIVRNLSDVKATVDTLKRWNDAIRRAA